MSFARPEINVTIVVGPPAAGKTTYVMGRMKSGDLVVDMDRLYEALTAQPQGRTSKAALPFVAAARDAVVSRIVRGGDIGHAWVVATLPEADKRKALAARLRARVLVLDVDEATCIERIRSRDGDQAVWAELVRDWWRRYQPQPGDELLAQCEG